MVKIPRGDKTGPEGKGPKTGRGLGDCKKTTSKQNTQSTRRGLMGQGRGRGVGRGRR